MGKVSRIDLLERGRIGEIRWELACCLSNHGLNVLSRSVNIPVQTELQRDPGQPQAIRRIHGIEPGDR